MFLTSNSDLSDLKIYPRLYKTWQWFSALSDTLGRLPSRRDINPIEIPFVLGYEVLTEFHRDENFCRFRLVGVVLEEFTGLPTSATGLRYNEMLDPESNLEALETMASVLDKGQPLFGPSSLRRNDGPSLEYARVICPLKKLEGEPEMIFIVFEDMYEKENS